MSAARRGAAAPGRINAAPVGRLSAAPANRLSAAPIKQLDVWYGDALAGTLHDTTPMAFEYAPGWLSRTQPIAIAAIPPAPDRNDSAAVQAFFENLLPEGELRQTIATRSKASTLFALLRAVAGDTAGGFVILPAGVAPANAPGYEATSWQALATQLGKSNTAAIDLNGRSARVSLAGAQDKTSIALFADGVPRLPRGTAPSTHILKPDIRRLNKVWHSAVNETIVMLTAARCGLPTAEVFYEPHTRACLVRRFDRFMQPEGRLGGQLGRLIQYDICQLAGIVSDKKYEREGGPGIAACAELIRAHSSQPAADLRHYVLWILFNLFTGNNDSHAKNLALLDSPGKGMTLAPFYDLMCTRLYPGLSAEFAFSIGGEFRPGHLNREHLDAMSADLRMRPQFIANLAGELAGKLPDAIAHAVATVRPLLTPAGKALTGRLTAFIAATTAKTARRLKLPVSPAAARAPPAAARSAA